MLNAIVPSKARIHSFCYLLNKDVLRAYTVCQTTVGVGIMKGQKIEKISAPVELFFFFFFRELRQNIKEMRTGEKRIRISVVLSTRM